MTLDEFFALLPKDGWEVNEYNFIRHATTNECPVCFVANHYFNRDLSNIQWKSAATIMNLPQDIASQIVSAADYYLILDLELRQKFLDYFGLTDTLQAD